MARAATLSSAPAPGRHEQEALEFAAQKRDLRRKLEALQVGTGEADAHAAWPYLADADPLIRHATRIALEQRPREELFARHDTLPAIDASDNEALPIRVRLELLQSIVRSGDPDRAARVVDELLELPIAELDLSNQFAMAFLYAECLARAPKQVAQRSEKVARQLACFWPDPDAGGLRVSPFGSNHELRRRLARLLAALGDPSLVDRVATTVLTGPAQEDRLLGLLALRNTRHGWTKDTRRAYFSALRDARQFVGGEGLPGFLDHLRNDALATLGEADRSEVDDLLAPGAADDEPLPPPRPRVAVWTLKDLKPLADKDATFGDAKRGATIFREALCSRCHRAGATGPAVGPDLTYVARRFDRGDLLEAIVEPSRSVAENYRNVTIITDSGQVLVGRLAATGDFRAEKLRLNVDPLHPGQIIEIDKKEVEEQRLDDTSPMPHGLLDGFTREEIADLLAFLEEGVRVSP